MAFFRAGSAHKIFISRSNFTTEGGPAVVVDGDVRDGVDIESSTFQQVSRMPMWDELVEVREFNQPGRLPPWKRGDYGGVLVGRQEIRGFFVASLPPTRPGYSRFKVGFSGPELARLVAAEYG